MRKNSKILSIQALRGIAAALVVIYHAQALLAKFTVHGARDAWLNGTQGLRSFGGIGVDIFFVISGAVITYVSWNLFGKPDEVATFLKKTHYPHFSGLLAQSSPLGACFRLFCTSA